MSDEDFYKFAQGYAKAFVSMGRLKSEKVDAFVQGMICGRKLNLNRKDESRIK
jgi:hypothetical protein